jgi:DNA-binding MarR family transcriptional regulator
MNDVLSALAWKQALKPTPKLVLLFLEGCAGVASTCSPSIEAIRKHVGVSTPSVYVALNTLEKAGLIEREARPAASNFYRLYLTEAPEA